MWEVVKGLLAYDALKWLWRNIFALGCLGLGIVILLFPLVWMVGQTLLAILGWEWVYKSIVKRPTLGSGLLGVTGIASIVCIIGGIAVLMVQGPPAETSSGNTLPPAGGIMFIVGLGYLYYGGAALGLVRVLDKRKGNSGVQTKKEEKEHCPSCGCERQVGSSFCVRCGARL